MVEPAAGWPALSSGRDQLDQAFVVATCGHYLGAWLPSASGLADPLVVARDRRDLIFDSCAIPIPPLIQRNSEKQVTTTHQ
jgi:hypothetical protein